MIHDRHEMELRITCMKLAVEANSTRGLLMKEAEDIYNFITAPASRLKNVQSENKDN